MAVWITSCTKYAFYFTRGLFAFLLLGAYQWLKYGYVVEDPDLLNYFFGPLGEGAMCHPIGSHT